MGVAKSDVYADKILTNISVKYSNDNYVADRIFPTVEVDKDTGIYYTYDKTNIKKVDSKRAENARAKRVEMGLTKSTYGPLDEHSLEDYIPDRVMDQAENPLNPRTDTTENISEMLLVEKEYDLAAYMSDTSNITNNTTLSGTDQWSNSASSPFTNIKTAAETIRKAVLKKPNTLLLSASTWAELQQHPDLIDRVKYSQVATITESLMKTLFPWIQNLIIGDAVYNTAVEGQSDSLTDVWGKHAWVMYVEPRPRIKSVSAGYTLRKRNARKAERWYEQAYKREVVRVTDYYEQKVIANEAMYLIKNAVA